MGSTQVRQDQATILVVDDDPVFLRAIRRLLESGAYNVETFESGDELLRRGAPAECSCLIADLRMPGWSGLELQDELNELEYTLPIIFLTGAGDVESSVAAMKHGAVDFLPKPVEKDVLFSAIEEALEKDCRERALFERRVRAKDKIARLTPREKEVMDLVITGMPNKQIAYSLGISEKTVKAHRSRVMHKVGAKSIVHLVALSELACSASH